MTNFCTLLNYEELVDQINTNVTDNHDNQMPITSTHEVKGAMESKEVPQTPEKSVDLSYIETERASFVEIQWTV